MKERRLGCLTIGLVRAVLELVPLAEHPLGEQRDGAPDGHAVDVAVGVVRAHLAAVGHLHGFRVTFAERHLEFAELDAPFGVGSPVPLIREEIEALSRVRVPVGSLARLASHEHASVLHGVSDLHVFHAQADAAVGEEAVLALLLRLAVELADLVTPLERQLEHLHFAVKLDRELVVVIRARLARHAQLVAADDLDLAPPIARRHRFGIGGSGLFGRGIFAFVGDDVEIADLPIVHFAERFVLLDLLAQEVDVLLIRGHLETADVADGRDDARCDRGTGAVHLREDLLVDVHLLDRVVELAHAAFLFLFEVEIDDVARLELVELGFDVADSRQEVAGRSVGGADRLLTQPLSARDARLLRLGPCTQQLHDQDAGAVALAHVVEQARLLQEEPRHELGVVALVVARPVVLEGAGGETEDVGADLLAASGAGEGEVAAAAAEHGCHGVVRLEAVVARRDLDLRAALRRLDVVRRVLAHVLVLVGVAPGGRQPAEDEVDLRVLIFEIELGDLVGRHVNDRDVRGVRLPLGGLLDAVPEADDTLRADGAEQELGWGHEDSVV